MLGISLRRSRMVVVFAVLALVATTLALPSSIPQARASDHTVGSGQTYTTILDALADAGGVVDGDTLLIDPGTYTGLHMIDRSLTLMATSSGVVIDGAGGGTPITVEPGTIVYLDGVEVTGGTGTSEFTTDQCGGGGCTRYKGGGILNAGDLTLLSTVVTGNTVDNPGDFIPNDGGGIYNESGATLHVSAGSSIEFNEASYRGGGIYNDGGTVTVSGSDVSFNQAMNAESGELFLNSGGGISSDGGTLTIDGSTFLSNEAVRSGGAIFADTALIEIADSTFGGEEYGNSAGLGDTGFGGAINAEGGTLTIDNTRFRDNSADGGAGVLTSATTTITNSSLSGGVATSTGGSGLWFSGASSTVSNTTISENASFSDTGALFAASGATVDVNNVTINANTASGTSAGIRAGGGAVITLSNTIVSGNLAGGVDDDCTDDGGTGTIASAGYNIMGDTADDLGTGPNDGCTFTATTGDQTDVLDPGLEALAFNGGSTRTQRLLLSSPALDAGNPVAPGSGGGACEALDQIGNARPDGAACDIGAYEGSEPFYIQAAIDAADPGDTIIIPPGTYYEMVTIAKDLTLDGGSAVTIDGAFDGAPLESVIRISDEESNPEVSLIGLTVTNGSDSGVSVGSNTLVTIEDSVIVGNFGYPEGGSGGGIANFGSLAIYGSVVTDNFAGSSGGGIYNAGDLELNDTTISDNETYADGGGLYSSGTVVATGSTFSGNTAGYDGGGLYLAGPTMADTLVITGNEADNGGGAALAVGGINIDSSTMSANLAAVGAGFVDGSASGANALTNSTISGNIASIDAGGFYKVAAGTLALNNTTVVDNEAIEGGGFLNDAPGTTTLSNSIVALNEAGEGPDCGGTVVDGGYNVLGRGGVGDPGGGTAAGCGLTDGVNGNQVGYRDTQNLDPVIGALADNGGGTETHALLPISPAIDAGNPAVAGSGSGACEATSQNDIDRTTGACDVGAFQVEPGSAPAISLTVSVDDPAPFPGVSSVPVIDLPAEVVTTGVAAEQESSIALTPIQDIQSSPINSVPINSVPINSVPINSVPINSVAYDSILLNDVPVEGGWETLLDGSTLTGPVQNYTFLDALDDPVVADRINALSFGALGLDDTGVAKLPIVAIALGATPINSVPINSVDANDPVAILNEWCALLAGSAADCATLEINPQVPSTADTAHMIALTLAGAPINSVPINSVPINSVDLLATPINSVPINSVYLADAPINSVLLLSTPINSVPINSVDLQVSPINSVPINSVPINSVEVFVDCAAFDCAAAAAAGDTFGEIPPEFYTGTFGQIVQTLSDFGQLDGLTLASILVGLPPDVSLADLVALLLPQDEYPWQEIDLGDVDLASFVPAANAVEYTASFTISNGSESNDVTFEMALPAGFVYVADSTAIDPPAPAADLEPVVDGASLQWSFDGLDDATTYDVTYAVAPGLSLGPVQSTGIADVPALGATSEGTLNLSVSEAYEPNDAAAEATVADADTLYVTHVGSATDRDFFRLSGVQAGSRISAVLGSLPEDYDLVLYAPTSVPLRADPERTVTGVEDEVPDLVGAAGVVQPEVIEDIPLDGLVVHSIATSRGLEDETIKTSELPVGGDYYLQVTGYNGATSVDPYTLRYQVAPPAPTPACTFVPPTGGTAGSLPASLPDGVNTLFLINQQRFEAVHGTEALNEVLASLATVAEQGSSGVVGAIIPVEGDGAVASAFSTWNTDPCSIAATNGAASAVATLVDGYRNANPGIEYVVVVGGDDQIPQFRIADEASIANERGYGALGAAVTPQTVALTSGYLLTDDPFADARPLIANGREIYVPEVALGRLVETPDEIVQTLEHFIAYNGLLDPSTATNAFVSGYDFLSDGAERVSGELDDSGRPVSNLISDAWNNAALEAGFLTGDLTVTSVNAHFDHNRAQPADDSDGLFVVDDVASSGTDTLDRAIIFSMGCHSALSVSDVQIGGGPTATDWAQTFAAQGASYVGNTGYGYGDTEVVALSETLMSFFAGNLDGAMTVGQALQFAKHQYAGSELLYGPYDDKVLMISTLYGLPFYQVGAGGQLPPPAEPLPTTVDGATGLTVAAVSLTPTVNGDLVRNETDRGDYFSYDVQDAYPATQVTPFRPIQPKIEIDVTQSGLVAHGALLTALGSVDVLDAAGGPFDPVIARPTVDLAENEPEPDYTGVFPAALQTVNRYLSFTGPRDQLVLVPGQFIGDGTGQGVQRLFTSLEATVYYAPAGATDFSPPTILSSTGVEVGGGVTFEVDVTDDDAVELVYVLFKNGAGAWSGQFLVNQGGNRWSGTAATTGLNEFFVQALDTSGNVAISSNKGLLFETTVGGAPTDLIELDGPQDGDWYDGPVTVTLDAGEGVDLEYDVDGSGLQPYTGPFEVTGDGVHSLSVSAGNGVVDSAAIPIDTLPPVVTSPIQAATFAEGSAVTVAFSCADAGSGVATCVGSLAAGSALPTTTSGSFTVTATDNLGRQTVEEISYTIIPTPTINIVEDVTTVDEGTELTFTTSSAGAPDSVAWTALRDGSLVAEGSGSSFTFVADDDGEYEVTAVGTFAGVASDPAVVSFTATNVAPTIVLTGDAEAASGEAYTMTMGPVVDPGDDHAFEYAINWGDGSPSEQVNALGAVTHTYDVAESVTITVDVTDEDGTFIGVSELELEVVAPTGNTAPEIVAFEGPAGPVSFKVAAVATATFVDPDPGDTFVVTLDWGDGTVTEPVPTAVTGGFGIEDSHLYAEPGVYTLTLTVTDEAGASDTATYDYAVMFNPAGRKIIASVRVEDGADQQHLGVNAKPDKKTLEIKGLVRYNFDGSGFADGFEATSLDYLWIFGNWGIVGGSGTIDGEGEYGFFVSTLDVSKSGVGDAYRIKIWNGSDPDDVVFDTQPGDTAFADPITEATSGNILVR